MLRKFWFEIKKFYKRLWAVIFPSPLTAPGVTDNEISIDIINDKIKLLKGTTKNSINIRAYQKYFAFYEKLGLREDFSVITTHDSLIIYATIIRPILLNANNQKVLIFCHGLTNNRWSLFYTMHLALQRGYQVVSYDARNHGLSGKSFNSLGQIEACDLQDVIDWVKKKYQPEKIGLYGFSMGAATLIFWLGYFAGASNSEVMFAICESPFDYFNTQWEKALGSGINYYWKHLLVQKMIKENLNSTHKRLEKINPFLVLPQHLPVKLLLLHGLKDVVIDWRASFKLHYQLSKNKLNREKVNLYLCRYSDHGEFPFLGDYIPNSLRWKNQKRTSRFTFTSLLCSYLQKNL